MPHSWWLNEVKSRTGKFREIDRRLGDDNARRVFRREWLPALLQRFTEQVTGNKRRLKGAELSLYIGGDWAY
jgi:hypothetical protein